MKKINSISTIDTKAIARLFLEFEADEQGYRSLEVRNSITPKNSVHMFVDPDNDITIGNYNETIEYFKQFSNEELAEMIVSLVYNCEVQEDGEF